MMKQKRKIRKSGWFRFGGIGVTALENLGSATKQEQENCCLRNGPLFFTVTTDNTLIISTGSVSYSVIDNTAQQRLDETAGLSTTA